MLMLATANRSLGLGLGLVFRVLPRLTCNRRYDPVIVKEAVWPVVQTGSTGPGRVRIRVRVRASYHW